MRLFISELLLSITLYLFVKATHHGAIGHVFILGVILWLVYWICKDGIEQRGVKR